MHSLSARRFALAAVMLAACNSRQAAVGSATSTSTVTSGSAIAAFDAITFERTPCFGTCPVYQVRVTGDGLVTFIGSRNVDSTGTYMARLDATRIAALRQAFDDARYFTLDDKYAYREPNCAEYGTDAPRILTSYSTADRTKRVDHDLGCANVPASLATLYRRFDQIVGTDRWIGRR